MTPCARSCTVSHVDSERIEITREEFEQHVSNWPVGDAVPHDMARVLKTMRSLLVQSFDNDEFSLVAVTWGLLALEACLRVCLCIRGENKDLGRLLSLARHQGLITKPEFKVLDECRKIRNDITHGHLILALPPQDEAFNAGIAMVAAIHGAIVDIYGRAAGLPSEQRSTP